MLEYQVTCGEGAIARFDPHWIALGPALTFTAEQIDEVDFGAEHWRSAGDVVCAPAPGSHHFRNS
jgi:hypothetical protein